jgi:hypothetical protein
VGIRVTENHDFHVLVVLVWQSCGQLAMRDPRIDQVVRFVAPLEGTVGLRRYSDMKGRGAHAIDRIMDSYFRQEPEPRRPI